MRDRRLAQVESREDDKDVPLASRLEEINRSRQKLREINKHKRNKEDTESEYEEEEEKPDAQPIGDVVRVSGEGTGRRNHYSSFEYDGNQYDLEDSILLVPDVTEHRTRKPYVAIIKDITQTLEGAMMVTGQWFYRPEEAEKRGCEDQESSDARVLYYSFNQDEVPAESVMHKCIVHFIPPNKQIPQQKKHPGFIVQKVYDTKENKVFKLTRQDYQEDKGHEMDLLVQKTISRIGELPDLEPQDIACNLQEDPRKKKHGVEVEV